MEETTGRRRRSLLVLLCMIIRLVNVFRIHAYPDDLSPENQFSGSHYLEKIKKMHAFKSSFAHLDSTSSPSISPLPSFIAPAPSPSVTATPSPREYHVTSYGADPTGEIDSSDAILRAISDAVRGPGNRALMKGILNLGGVRISLDGGNYKISRPLRLPFAGRDVAPPYYDRRTAPSHDRRIITKTIWFNVMKALPILSEIHGGTLTASDDFPTDGYLIDLSTSSAKDLDYIYEFVTLRDLMLDSNFRGGGVQVIDSLRTSIDNCYITHFTSYGIFVQGGHETYIRNSFLGQHITAGGDSEERHFSGTAISLGGNDNAVTDVVIFSAAIGIIILGQANTLSGVHCYNKATSFGGTGIYLKLPGLTQTRIVNCYLDYTGIVAEDPVQLHISSSFFLGDAFILLKSINGVANGVSIVDNMFSGSNKGIDIVQLDQRNGEFKEVEQVVVDRNNVRGMNVKATVARGTVTGNDSSWTVDLNEKLLFPNVIKNVQYSLIASGSVFPNHALRNVSDNRVVVVSDVVVPASVTVMVGQ